jgi:hypothetical protein
VITKQPSIPSLEAISHHHQKLGPTIFPSPTHLSPSRLYYIIGIR